MTAGALWRTFQKLKKGKVSPDGCTAEMYRALPDIAKQSLAFFSSSRLAPLVLPDSWTVVSAVLMPREVGAAASDKFRGIACLSVALNLLGYTWMQMLLHSRLESKVVLLQGQMP